MQSDRNSFCGDVVLDGFNIVMKTVFKSKSMKSKYLVIFIRKILYLELIEENAYLKKYSMHNNKELTKLGFMSTVVLVSIFFKKCYKELKSS